VVQSPDRIQLAPGAFGFVFVRDGWFGSWLTDEVAHAEGAKSGNRWLTQLARLQCHLFSRRRIPDYVDSGEVLG
jgi:hypothetical protein